MKADHVLHYTPGGEGYGSWRLECIQDVGYHHSSWMEDFQPPGTPCRCLRDGNDCEDCREDDHGACGYYGMYIFDIGFSCMCIEDPSTCWAQDWFDNTGADWIADGDWKEDGPWYCHADPETGLEYVDHAAEIQGLMDRIAAGLDLPPGVTL